MSKTDIDKITKKVEGLTGVVSVDIEANELPNIVTVAHRNNGVPLRGIISEIKDLGYTSARYLAESDDNNIQNILE